MSNDYIYESPDGGKTVTRRKFGDKTKETIITPPLNVDSDLSDDELTLRFKSIKKKLMTAQLRAHWFKDHQNEHTVAEVMQLVDELEQEITLTTSGASVPLSSLLKTTAT
jgi:hypothetical protein|tara:strand:- start:943 stop:1272 length:330 start_codon:yes stop_codon:yes gene_type:complete